MNLQIVETDLAAIRPDPRNPRRHPRKQIEQLKRSIAAFGFTNPILVDGSDCIICGHGRYAAARESGLVTVPVVRLPHLSEAQVIALRLADNKIALGGVWDAELLKVELSRIESLDISFDLELTGFESAEIDVHLRAGASPDPADEDIPAVPTAPVTQPGDIWVLGEHRIGCGDVGDAAFLRLVMGDGATADAAVLDPPYNVPISGHAVAKGSHADFACAIGEMTPGQFQAFLSSTLGACAAVSRSGAVHFVFMDHGHLAELAAAGDAVYGKRLNVCVWNKSNAGMGGLYRSKHELVFVYKVGEGAYHNGVQLGRHGRNRSNVWDYASVNTFRASRKADLKLHPTVKPCALVADAIADVTRRGELVLDGFLGSGTTLLACERIGRRCRGVELEPKYVDVAVLRWREATGGDVVHAITGAPFGAATLKLEAA